MYQTMCCCEGTGIHSTALGSAAADRNSGIEKPPPWWVHSPGEASKDVGVPGSQDADRKLWAILPLAASAWNQQRAWHRKGKQFAWMDALFPRFSLPTTMLTESRPRRIAQSTAYAREAEATGLPVQVECHHLPRQNLCLDWPGRPQYQRDACQPLLSAGSQRCQFL
jgi:hypothetical protein